MKGYPVLKETVRIKKMKHFCWIMEPLSGTDRSIAPVEAFVLASLNGELTFDELAYFMEKLFDMTFQQAAALLEGIFSKMSDCIIYQKEPGLRPSGFEPSSFLYPVDPEAIVKQERLDTPSELHFSLTHACNFRCIYCFNASAERAGNEMQTGEWLGLIRQAKELGVLKCTLTGGEPALHPGIYNILHELKEQDIIICLCTNGSIFNPVLGKLLEGSTVQVSLDTDDPKIHHKLTGLNSLDRVMNNIRNFAGYGANVQVKCVLTPFNLNTVGTLYTACRNLGVKKLVLDRFDVSSCGRGDTGLLITEEEMEEVRKSVRQVYDKEGMEVVTAFHPHNWKGKEDIIPCAAFRRSLIILPDGEVSACEKILDIPEMRVGNVRKSTLYDIWKSERIDSILNPPRDKMDPECGQCRFFDYCNTGCYALKAYYKKPLFGRDPRCSVK